MSNSYKSVRLGGAVKRFHTQETIRTQTVAAHSWGVVSILFEICLPSVQLLKAACYHDVAEHVFGDIPSPAKWSSPDLACALQRFEERVEGELGIRVPLGPDEKVLLKMADMLEMVWFCAEEMRLGNGGMRSVIIRCRDWFQDQEYFPTTAAFEFTQETFRHAGCDIVLQEQPRAQDLHPA